MGVIRGFSQESRRVAALTLRMRTLRLRQGSHLCLSHSDYVSGSGAQPEMLSICERPWVPPPASMDWLLVKSVVTVLQPWEHVRQRRKCTVSFAPLIKPVNLQSDCSPFLKPGHWRPRELRDRQRGPRGPPVHRPGQPGGKALLATQRASLPIAAVPGEPFSRAVGLPPSRAPPATACAFPAGKRALNDRAKGKMPGSQGSVTLCCLLR